jgi:biopolymer transport protein ExbD
MRTLTLLMLALLVAAPLSAQETEKPAPDKTEEKGAEKADEPKKREMSDDGKLLFADVQRVYKKYYAIVLEKYKANEQYKTDDVWNEAVKEAKEAEYKDGTAFHDAITEMKRKDRVFKKEVQTLAEKLAKENAEAIEKWSKDQKK